MLRPGYCFLGVLVALTLTAVLGLAGTAVARVDPKTQASSGQVDVLFEPPPILSGGDQVAGRATYRVYRHARSAASPNDRTFRTVGQASVEWSSGVGGWAWTVTSSSVTDAAYMSWEAVDAGTSRYLSFRDRAVTDYEEYYYLVTENAVAGATSDPAPDDSVGDQPWVDYGQWIIVSAFPPTQTRHGSYTEFTGACTGCHGLHSAKLQKLLKGPTATDLCATCHDGTGSKYDEANGWVYMGPARGYAPAPAGPFGEQMKAGVTGRATSVHNLYRAGGPAYALVYQAPGSGFDSGGPADQVTANGGSGADLSPVGWKNQLSCISCHEPHNRGRNFRLLRNDINDLRTGDGPADGFAVRGLSEVNTDGQVVGGEEWPQAYADAENGGSPLPPGFVVRFSQTKLLQGTAKFCSQCHRAFYSKTILEVNKPTVRRMVPTLTDAQVDEIVRYWADLPPLGAPTAPPQVMVDRCDGCHTFYYNNQLVPNMTANIGWDTVIHVGQATGNHNLDTAGGASPGNVEGLGYRHPTQVPAYRLKISDMTIDGPISQRQQQELTDDIFQHRLKDGPVNIGVSLEGGYYNGYYHTETAYGQFSPGTYNVYPNNDVVCLTCHMAHGSRAAGKVDVAYDNGALNGTDSTDVARHPVSGYYTYVGPDGQQTPAENQIGVSAALARLEPMASVCFRCHSTKSVP